MSTVTVTASVSATLKDVKAYAGNGGYRNDSYHYGYNKGVLNEYNYFISYPGYGSMPQQFVQAMNTLPGTGSKVKMSINVTEPGIVEVPNLYENSGGQFRYVFFPEAGTFSLVRIYKFMRSEIGQAWAGTGLSVDRIPGYLEHPRTDKQSKKQLKDNQELAAVMKLEIVKVLPYGVDDVKALKKLEIFRETQRKVKRLDFLKKARKAKAKVAEKTVVAEASENPYSKYMVIEGRYIPLVQTTGNKADYYSQTPSMHYVAADGNLISTNTEVLPNTPGSNGLSAGLYSLVTNGAPGMMNFSAPQTSTYYTGWYDRVLNIMLYDTETSKIITSPELSHMAHTAMREALAAGTASYEKSVAALVNNISATDFLEQVNGYMKSRGFINFNISSAIPMHFRDAAEVHNWTNGGHKNYKGEWTPSFNIEVEYSGRKIIGYGGKANGHLIAEMDDKGRAVMVQSAWCQRVSKWTKRRAIDQKNRDWFLDDWLAGPWAENTQLKIKEAPIVYYGNHGKKKDRKAAILKKMRALQNNL